jgi:CPW-WPC domain-containing protein
MMSRAVLCSLVLGSVAALEVAQPYGVEAALAGLRSKIEGIDGAIVADPVAYERVAGEAASGAVADLAASSRSRAIAAVADGVARSSIASWKYVGGCPRDFSGCPVDWATGSDGVCSPPLDDEGSCGVSVVSSMSASQKEALAVSCRASWPCKACVVSFAGCPQGWTAEGQSCASPSGYTGACGPLVDFSGMSSDAKARWAAMCNVVWPCA